MSGVEVFPKNGKLSLQGHRPRVISDSRFEYPEYVSSKYELLNVLVLKLNRAPKIKKRAYDVALNIYQHMNNKRPFKSFTSLEVMAQELSYGLSTVRRGVQDLFDNGIIYNQQNTKRRSTYYYVEFDIEFFIKANPNRYDVAKHHKELLVSSQHSEQLPSVQNGEQSAKNGSVQNGELATGQHSDSETVHQGEQLILKEPLINLPKDKLSDHQDSQPSNEVDYPDEVIEENKRKIKEATNGAVKNSNPEYVKEKEKNQSFGYKQYTKFWTKKLHQLSNDGVNEWFIKRDTLTDKQVEAVGLAWSKTNDLKKTTEVFEGLAR
ncbi:hypothetical protein N9I63_01475 [Hyphomicrobiales bacterium]|nr:hypothetical protein [Hyphomicrobiales bacterium]